MYRRPKFLEILDEVRQQMSREVDYDVDLFAELIRSGQENKERKAGKKEEIYTFPSIAFDDLPEKVAPKTKK